MLDWQDWSCVRLVYQISGRGSLHLHRRPDSDNFDYRLWAADKASDSWLISSVDLPNSTMPYQVGLAVSPYRSTRTSAELICCIVKLVQDVGAGRCGPQFPTTVYSGLYSF